VAPRGVGTGVVLQPKSVEAQIALGIARLRSGDSQSGLKSFRRAVELNPSSAEAHYNLGLGLRESVRRSCTHCVCQCGKA
jgi:Flp pilus assembly protein TadD